MDVELLNDLNSLQFWAPGVLEQGKEASREDLMKVFKLRISMVDRVAKVLEEGLGSEPFLLLIRADKVCAPHCAALLNLPLSEIEEASGDTPLDPYSWYGIHKWDFTRDVLPKWVSQLRELAGIEATEAEVLDAFFRIADDKASSPDGSPLMGLSEDGSFWKETLDPGDVEKFSQILGEKDSGEGHCV